jgi:hypothetical protein
MKEAKRWLKVDEKCESAPHNWTRGWRYQYRRGHTGIRRLRLKRVNGARRGEFGHRHVLAKQEEIWTQKRTRFADFIVASVQQISIIELLKKKENNEIFQTRGEKVRANRGQSNDLARWHFERYLFQQMVRKRGGRLRLVAIIHVTRYRGRERGWRNTELVFVVVLCVI